MDDDAIRGLNSARRLSYGEQLARSARKTPDARALRFEGQELSFRELDERVTKLSNALAERGTSYGDRVATFMMNRLEVVETYLAAARLGAICVPINFRLVPDEVTYIATDSGATALVVDADLARTAGTVRERVPDLTTCLVVSDDPEPAGPGAELYEPVLAAASDEAPIIDVNEHEPAFIMYTSGTTGRPKGATLSHFNLLINTYNVMASIGVREADEVFLSGLPLFHIGGLNLISTRPRRSSCSSATRSPAATSCPPSGSRSARCRACATASSSCGGCCGAPRSRRPRS
jgi:fatty-acyl-CoA synthase/long-chain acyl-CoA synthetase